MTLDLTADLYEACLQISPRHPDYATLPIEDGFDWSCLSAARFESFTSWSSVPCGGRTADLDAPAEHDDRAYEEALSRAASSATSRARERAGRVPVFLPLGDARAGQRGR